MRPGFCRRYFVWCREVAIAAICFLALSARAQAEAPACVASPSKQLTPADNAYAQGKFAEAEGLYRQTVAQRSNDATAVAGLARTQLRLGKVAAAKDILKSALAESPKSVPLLVELGEVQLREGQPWLARETLHAAEQMDPCYARIFLIRSRIDRLDSMYASQRAEIARAYAIDPADAEIKRAWNRTVAPADEVASTEEYLVTTKDIEPGLRKTAEASVHDILRLLSETSQTCQILPTLPSAVIPLHSSMQDGKHVDGYQLEMELPRGKVMLGVDTAASGVYLSRAVVEANGLTSRPEDPKGTVHADSLQIGPLTFQNCVVGVSDTVFPGKISGMIGTDLFDSYLVTLNFPDAKLELGALPPVKTSIPGDRVQTPELLGYSPVYHRLQYLLVPVMLNGKERRLFALDSGLRLSAMTLPVAHLVSSTRLNFTNSIKTTSGATLQVYRDSFDFQFANLLLRSRSGVLQFDPASIELAAGIQIGGMLGFDMLHAAVLHLDYRDGLVNLSFPDGQAVPAGNTTSQVAGLQSGAGEAEDRAFCTQTLADEVPAAATIEARTLTTWDPSRMKVGSAITVKVVHAFEVPTCRLEIGSLLYGHVTAADSAKDGAPAQLGISLDEAECWGKGKQERQLKLISILAPVEAYQGTSSRGSLKIGKSGGQSSEPGDVVDLGDSRNQNREKTPTTIQTGSVQGLPGLQLKADGGPSCSALLSSSNKSLRLQQDTKIFIVMPEAPSR